MYRNTTSEQPQEIDHKKKVKTKDGDGHDDDPEKKGILENEI